MFTKTGGIFYIEVPAPHTCCHPESNANHYSVLGKRIWINLMQRSGFVVVKTVELNITIDAGPDVHYSLLLQKPETTKKTS